MATLSHPNPTWFRPDNRWLLVGACLSLALLIGVPALWSVKHMVLACGAVLVVGSVLFSVERSLFLLLFLNIVLPIKILLVMRLPGGLRFQEGLLLAVIVFALIDLIYTKGLTLRLSRADIPLLTFLGASCLF